MEQGQHSNGHLAQLWHGGAATRLRVASARGARLWVRLWKSDEAGAAIEFALVGAPFIAILLATLNTALVFLAQEGLETAGESAARLLLTGRAQTLQYYNGSTLNTGMTAAQFQNAICGTLTYSATANATTQTTYNNGTSLLPPFLSCSNLAVNVTTAANYNSTSLSPPTFTYNSNGSVASTGTGYNVSSSGSGQSTILVVQLLYLWPTTTGPLGFSLSNQANGDDMLVATEVITTENYACPTGVSTC
jgi:Flp pilus assembly protein TadG